MVSLVSCLAVDDLVWSDLTECGRCVVHVWEDFRIDARGSGEVDEEVQTPLCGQTVYSAGQAKH